MSHKETTSLQVETELQTDGEKFQIRPSFHSFSSRGSKAIESPPGLGSFSQKPDWKPVSLSDIKIDVGYDNKWADSILRVAKAYKDEALQGLNKSIAQLKSERKAKKGQKDRLGANIRKQRAGTLENETANQVSYMDHLKEKQGQVDSQLQDLMSPAWHKISSELAPVISAGSPQQVSWLNYVSADFHASTQHLSAILVQGKSYCSRDKIEQDSCSKKMKDLTTKCTEFYRKKATEQEKIRSANFNPHISFDDLLKALRSQPVQSDQEGIKVSIARQEPPSTAMVEAYNKMLFTQKWKVPFEQANTKDYWLGRYREIATAARQENSEKAALGCNWFLDEDPLPHGILSHGQQEAERLAKTYETYNTPAIEEVYDMVSDHVSSPFPATEIHTQDKSITDKKSQALADFIKEQLGTANKEWQEFSMASCGRYERLITQRKFNPTKRIKQHWIALEAFARANQAETLEIAATALWMLSKDEKMKKDYSTKASRAEDRRKHHQQVYDGIEKGDGWDERWSYKAWLDNRETENPVAVESNFSEQSKPKKRKNLRIPQTSMYKKPQPRNISFLPNHNVSTLAGSGTSGATGETDGWTKITRAPIPRAKGKNSPRSRRSGPSRLAIRAEEGCSVGSATSANDRLAQKLPIVRQQLPKDSSDHTSTSSRRALASPSTPIFMGSEIGIQTVKTHGDSLVPAASLTSQDSPSAYPMGAEHVYEGEDEEEEESSSDQEEAFWDALEDDLTSEGTDHYELSEERADLGRQGEEGDISGEAKLGVRSVARPASSRPTWTEDHPQEVMSSEVELQGDVFKAKALERAREGRVNGRQYGNSKTSACPSSGIDPCEEKTWGFDDDGFSAQDAETLFGVTPRNCFSDSEYEDDDEDEPISHHRRPSL